MYLYVSGFSMQTKLTLRLDRDLIELAKEQAKHQGKSLSQIVADYFTVFTQDTKNQPVAPVTQSLIGILKESSIDEEDYNKHLEEKYL